MLGDSITALVTDRITIRRTPATVPVDGIYPDGTPTTFQCDVVMQPAFGLNRVVGGADLHGMVDGQHATDVRVFQTLTEVKTLSPGFEPDVVVGFEGADWTVARSEKWPILNTGFGRVRPGAPTHYWRCIVTKITSGSS